MEKRFHEAFAAEEIQPPSERSTGLVFCAVSCIVAAFNYDNFLVAGISLTVAAVFLLVSLSWPALLAPLNRAWFALSILLGKIVNPLVMFLLFAVIITPAGLIMRLVRDPLQARKRPDSKTYWIDRALDEDTVGSMKDQF